MINLTQLGIDINGDGGLLFYTVIVIFILSLLTLWFSRSDIPFIGGKFFSVVKA